jgi:hypothetical protein
MAKMFAGMTLLPGVFRIGTLDSPWKQKPAHKCIDWSINVTKNEDTHQQSCHCQAVPPQPVQVTLRRLFTHEEQDHGASVERRYWKQIKRAKEQVQRKENQQSGRCEITMARDGVGMKPPFSGSQLQSANSDKHQQKICRRSGKSHPSRPPRMPPFPKRIIGRTRPSHHPISTHHEVREDRDHNHAPGFAPHVGHWIQRDLTALGRRIVASHLGDQRVRGLVTSRRKEECHEPNEPENEKLRSDIRQLSGPFAYSAQAD